MTMVMVDSACFTCACSCDGLQALCEILAQEKNSGSSSLDHRVFLLSRPCENFQNLIFSTDFKLIDMFSPSLTQRHREQLGLAVMHE